MKKKILVLLGTILILASCATGGGNSSSKGRRPDWVDDKHSVYPDDEYLVEIGEGSSLKKAKQDGIAALTQIFRTTVKVDSTVLTRYQDLSDGDEILESSMETSVDESITQLSDETLINVHFGESWTDDMGRTYVAAYINRMDTAMIYRERINQDSERTRYFMDESAGQSDLLRKFGYLDAATVMDKNSQMMLEQLEIIHAPSSRMIMLSYEPDELNSLYNNTAKEMLYSISVDGDMDGKVTNTVAQVLTGRGFSVTDGTGNLSVTGSVSVEDAALNNGYENVRWFLYMEMRNEAGEVVATMEEQQRETGISKEAAVAKAYRSMEEMLQKKFIGDLERYFDSFAGK